MPSSTYKALPFILQEIIKTQPSSILDIGIGFGKWGFLCREYLESWNNRVYPKDWTVQIDGVEIWKDYIEKLPWLKTIYNTVHLGDACRLVNNLQSYDVIIAGDIIEHVDKVRGITLIKSLKSKTKQKLILSIPLGSNWMENKIVAGNPYEEHQAIWNELEIKTILGDNTILHTVKEPRGDIGVFIHEK